MSSRDYVSAPVSESLGLREVILGLSADLDDMREGRISPQDGMARAAVAKQLFNGVRLYLQALKSLEDTARPAGGNLVCLQACLRRTRGEEEVSRSVNPGENARRVLIIKLSALGDFVLALGAMRAIRAAHPKAQLTLLTTPPYEALAKATGFFQKPCRADAAHLAIEGPDALRL